MHSTMSQSTDSSDICLYSSLDCRNYCVYTRSSERAWYTCACVRCSHLLSKTTKSGLLERVPSFAFERGAISIYSEAQPLRRLDLSPCLPADSDLDCFYVPHTCCSGGGLPGTHSSSTNQITVSGTSHVCSSPPFDQIS